MMPSFKSFGRKDAAQSRNSFQSILVKRLTLTGFTLAIIAAFIYSYFSSNVIENFYQKEGTQAAENFAQLSELALLYDSGENGREAAIATLNFPSIKHVAIINSENQILFGEGNTNEPTLNTLTEDYWFDDNAKIIESNSNVWQIAAPVFASYEYESDADLMLDNEIPQKNYLGYVAVQVDASTVRQVQNDMFLRNLIIGLSYGLTFLIVVSVALRKLLEPMNALAKVMDDSKDGSYLKSELDENASLEIQTMSNAYNQMISALAERDHKLRSQKELLETEVAIRTSELIQARDSALEANQHKSEFFANVTHELRTPLQSILGYAELISENLEDEGLEYCDTDVEKISRNANHLLDLINTILDISKIDAGKMRVHAQKTNIKELIISTADIVRPLVEKNDNVLILEIDDSFEQLFIDGKKISQILINLISNAAKFTQSGTISISAHINNMVLTLSVSDTGIGINKEKQLFIFEPFRQIDGSESRKFVGTGLGLSIILKLTEILGGQINLESEPGVGSTFTIELPIESEEKIYDNAI